MKQILDAISLCRMICKDGLKNSSFADTMDFVDKHFEKMNFESEIIADQLQRLAKEITSLRANYEYLK